MPPSLPVDIASTCVVGPATPVVTTVPNPSVLSVLNGVVTPAPPVPLCVFGLGPLVAAGVVAPIPSENHGEYAPKPSVLSVPAAVVPSAPPALSCVVTSAPATGVVAPAPASFSVPAGTLAAIELTPASPGLVVSPAVSPKLHKY